MKLSIITSLYRSEPYIAEFHRRIRPVAAEITPDYEFIYVNDGSPDGVLGVALRLQEEEITSWSSICLAILAIIAP